jgi:hypothetical protein
MSLIKKIDVNEHFAARRAMRLGRMRRPGQLSAAEIEQATVAKNAAVAATDGPAMLSSPTASDISIPNAEDSDGTPASAERRSLNN